MHIRVHSKYQGHQQDTNENNHFPPSHSCHRRWDGRLSSAVKGLLCPAKARVLSCRPKLPSPPPQPVAVRLDMLNHLGVEFVPCK
ncbi:hypothetical protein O6P43_001089 [Quillaja saponaria]|uniref:Uncharacterized protein n=1 Tax=Quillaja saponaria TaxID=32244 RepID=A0AAD7QJF1_QUISA|nr:hypothetical protein O6P43_001089 [Quillaja saponaria]